MTRAKKVFHFTAGFGAHQQNNRKLAHSQYLLIILGSRNERVFGLELCAQEEPIIGNGSAFTWK